MSASVSNLGDCRKCAKVISGRAVTYHDYNYHPECFVCTKCHISLDGESFYVKPEGIFCTNCYTNVYAKQCDSCGEKIVGVKAMSFKGQNFHEHCFQCSSCDEPIGSKQFVQKDGKNICLPCHSGVKENACSKCGSQITEGVTYQEKPYHKECFLCDDCGGTLSGQSFFSHEAKLVCNACHVKNYAHTCAACNIIITGKSLLYKDTDEKPHYFHEDCFLCLHCRSTLAGKRFYTKANMQFLCMDCGKV